MTLLEMAQFVAAKTGSTDDASVSRAKDFIRARYTMVYDAHLFEDSKVLFALTVDEPIITLPEWVSRVMQVRFQDPDTEGSYEVKPESKDTMFMVDPEMFDRAGDPVVYSYLPSVGTHTSPEGRMVKVMSDSGDDSGEVRLRGFYNGLETSETIALQGSSEMTSTKYYDDITTFSKPETAGNITLKSSDDEELQVLLPGETQRRHPRIQLHPDRWTTMYVLVLAKRTVVPLVHDNDAPAVSGIENALIAYATGDMLERQRQYGKAQLKVQEGSALVDSLLKQERSQRTLNVRIIPDESFYAIQ